MFEGCEGRQRRSWPPCRLSCLRRPFKPFTESTHFNTGLRCFLEDLRHRRWVKTAYPACSTTNAFRGAARSPRSILWKAPDDGRQSNPLNRWAESMQFIQFNIRQPRGPEELLLLGRRRCPPIELDTGFGGLIRVVVPR
jgi:hypothetical protein